jgi:hypothetical protein
MSGTVGVPRRDGPCLFENLGYEPWGDGNPQNGSTAKSSWGLAMRPRLFSIGFRL